MAVNIYMFLAIALILGLLASKLVDRVRLPHVTGYLIMGLLAGPSFAGIISADVVSNLSFISDITLGFIAFSIGSEFKLDYLKKLGKSPIIIGICEALGASVLVSGILIVLGYDLSFALMLGAIASATAPAATLMIIRQYKAKGPVTFTLLPVVALDDAIAIVVFGIAAATAKLLQSPDSSSLLSFLGGSITEIFGGLVFGALLGVVLTQFTRRFKGKGNLLSIAIAMISLCVGVSSITGFSSLLSCMAMSAIYVNLSKTSAEVFELVDTVTPPLFMLFFFLSGAGLDIALIPTVGVVGIIYVLARIAGKVGGAALGAEISRTDPMVKKYLGFTLIPQAGVAIGLSAIAMNVVPEYSVQIRTIILFATIIYELVGPIITKTALIKAGEIQLEVREQEKTQPKTI